MSAMATSEGATLLLMNGRIKTVVPDHEVEALAIGGDRILAIGTARDLESLKGSRTEVIDLHGNTALPGFIDAHCHLKNLGASLVDINCKQAGMDSIPGIVDAIRHRASLVPAGTWIRARGYNHHRLKERRHPTRFDLDVAAPDHPVLVTRACGHISAFNTNAMSAVGLAPDSPDPPRGEFGREDGVLSGVAYEMAQLPFKEASALSNDEVRATLRMAQDAYLAAGCTGVHDAGGLIGPSFKELQTLADSGDWRLRVYAIAAIGAEDAGEQVALGLLESGIRTGFGDDLIRVGAFKAITDGASSGPTCATREPYASDPTDRGILYWEQDELNALVERANQAGFQVTMHAVGDRAIEAVLDAMEGAEEAGPGLKRPRIEHCAMVPDDLAARVAGLRVTAVMQPAFFWEFGDGYVLNYGRDRAEAMFPAKSLSTRGVVVAGSSDAPVTDHRPLFGIEEAITRATITGDVCGPGERLSLSQAIRLYTYNAAYASFAERDRGSLEVGKLADIVVLDADLENVPSEQIADIPIAATIVGGEIVFGQGLNG
jgi:predicted amidohydrolase YtcJ